MRPELIDTYVADGTLRIEWNDFAYQGQESVNAALAARAAQEQGKFWEYNRLLYENQAGSNSGGFAEENLIGFAEDLDLDTDRFRRDLSGDATREAVTADIDEGTEMGIAATPTFVINGEVIAGFRDYEAFSEAIEDAAGEAREEDSGG